MAAPTEKGTLFSKNTGNTFTHTSRGDNKALRISLKPDASLRMKNTQHFRKTEGSTASPEAESLGFLTMRKARKSDMKKSFSG